MKRPDPSEIRHIDAYRDNNGVLIVPFVFIMLAMWAWAVVYWLESGDLLGMGLRAYVGLGIGLGVGSYVALPRKFRPYARKVVMVYVGILLFFVALVSDHGNMAIEGLFFAVLSGVAPFVLIHYFIAKLIGPLVFGRLWCGWACWYGMIFDMLPYPFSYWRRDKRLSLLRYVHFFASGGLVALLWFGLGFQGTMGAVGIYWFLLGICIYYALGIVLALTLKDNRAFCKYVCPVSVPMKAVGRLSLVKMGGTSARCPEGCQTCIEMCPMNIRVKDYLFAKKRILSTECILCMTCVNVCPQEALAPSIRLDFGGLEYWDHDPTRGNQNTVPNVAWIHDDEEAGRIDTRCADG